jgi:hypothetical protein
MDELVPVEVACGCLATPHEQDVIYLRPRLGLGEGIAIERCVRDFLLAQGRAAEDAILKALTEYYLLFGIAKWNLVDADGKDIEVSAESITRYLLSDYARARPVADKGDELYKEPILSPLLRRAKNSSETTSPNGSISATRDATLRRPKRSKLSSTTTTPTDDIATTTL